MSNIDLKAYTRRAKELESAIYMQKKLMKEHEKIINSNIPQKPAREEINMTKPVEPCYTDYTSKLEYKSFLQGGILCVIISICAIYVAVQFEEVLLLWVFAVSIVLLSVFCFKKVFDTILINIERKKSGEKKYELDMEKYNKDLDEYNVAVSSVENQYKEKYETYKISSEKYNQNKLAMEQRHNNVLSSLETTLEQMYNENIIFPKYRNFVAITAINEYLESGRCSTLEGADGAYNLYEMELRQNIVIGQLSNIINNLEQIRNNQFSLYEELKKSNEKIDDIIYELKVLQQDTKLNLYFNYVTALAETSPKITHGIVY